MHKGIDRAEAKALLRRLPVTVYEDLTYKQAKDTLPWLMVGTSAWGITDAASAPDADSPGASSTPSEVSPRPGLADLAMSPPITLCLQA